MRNAALILVLSVVIPAAVLARQQPQPDKPTFRSGVEMVTVSAVVRNERGRPVTDLKRTDFELFDNGSRRFISTFRADQAPITLAVLFDASGSMQVAYKNQAARRTADQLLTWLRPGKDEVAVYTFDRELHEIQGFTRDEADIKRSMGELDEPFGLTSLHDAIAATARKVASRGGSHRGVIVLTDGVDTSSHLTPAQVSGIASAIDVPIYIVAVVSPLDHVGKRSAVVQGKESPTGELASLAEWTGGDMFVSSAPEHSGLAVRQIVDELRNQYLIAFEPSGAPGWHPLEIRLRDRRLTVRARGGYIAGPVNSGGN